MSRLLSCFGGGGPRHAEWGHSGHLGHMVRTARGREAAPCPGCRWPAPPARGRAPDPAPLCCPQAGASARARVLEAVEEELEERAAALGPLPPAARASQQDAALMRRLYKFNLPPAEMAHGRELLRKLAAIDVARETAEGVRSWWRIAACRSGGWLACAGWLELHPCGRALQLRRRSCPNCASFTALCMLHLAAGRARAGGAAQVGGGGAPAGRVCARAGRGHCHCAVRGCCLGPRLALDAVV